jgi:hypothetical protein
VLGNKNPDAVEIPHDKNEKAGKQETSSANYADERKKIRLV